MKSKSVEKMFAELLNLENLSTVNLSEIRCRFGLGSLAIEEDNGEDQDFFDDVYDEPAVIIKQENEENDFPFKGKISWNCFFYF